MFRGSSLREGDGARPLGARAVERIVLLFERGRVGALAWKVENAGGGG